MREAGPSPRRGEVWVVRSSGAGAHLLQVLLSLQVPFPGPLEQPVARGVSRPLLRAAGQMVHLRERPCWKHETPRGT